MAASESFRKIIERDKVVVLKKAEKRVEHVGEGGVSSAIDALRASVHPIRWMTTTIGALIGNDGGNIKTGPFGTILKAKEYSKLGVPLISVGEIGYGSLNIHDSTPRVPHQVIERLPEYLLEAGDIVFGRKGAVDRSAIVKCEQAGWFLGSDGIRLRLPNTCDSGFIAYQMQSTETRSWIIQHATGTTMASLNQAIIGRIPILLPPLA